MHKLKLLKFYWPKIFSIVLFILLIGAYTQIFAIGEPYDPGETLDPECAPGEINCTVSLNTTEGDPIVGAINGIVKSDGAGNIGVVTSGVDVKTINGASILGNGDISLSSSQWETNGDNIYYNDGNVGIGTNTPTSKLEIKLNSEITYNQTFSGSGLNDVTFSGEYNGNTPNAFYISIVQEGNPDSFDFYDLNGECDYQPSTIITGSPQLLCNGIYVTFSSISGHTLYDYWQYNITNNLLENGNVFSVKDSIDNYFTINAIAKDSNFLGYNSGINASGAIYSNFLGKNSGLNATNAYNSNFIGLQAGQNATNAKYSNFIGEQAGYGATDASYSTFIGYNAGYGATNASYSTFIGYNAGYQDVVNNNNTPFLNSSSILIGRNTRTGGFLNSVLIGGSTNGGTISNTRSNQFMLAPSLTNMRLRGIDYVLPSSQGEFNTVLRNNGDGTLSWSSLQIMSPISVLGAQNLVSVDLIYSSWEDMNLGYSILLGYETGTNSHNISESNFIGISAGGYSYDIYSSLFIGSTAGRYSFTINNSSFIGNGVGESSNEIDDSTFIGSGTGAGATNIQYSNFIGNQTGVWTSNALFSNFIGYHTGEGAQNSTYSNFIGYNSGVNTVNASNSIFIGRSAGYGDTVNNVGGNDFSILIGDSTNTGGYSNSIAIGGSATNTASNEFMIGSNTRPINTTVWVGASGTATLDTATGLITTSDERLKKNITDLEDNTLSKLINVRTVKFNWLNGDSDKTNIGFLAQDLENYFPELVYTGTDGYKGVNYANMTPVLVEAIREMDLKINDYSSLDINSDKSLGYLIKKFIEDESNFFNKIFTKTVVTEGIEMKDSATGEPYCVIITNGELKNIKGKCGEPVVDEEFVEDEEIVEEDIIEDQNDNLVIDDSLSEVSDEIIEIINDDENTEEEVEDITTEDLILIPKPEISTNLNENIQVEIQIENQEIIL